jgi:integrase
MRETKKEKNLKFINGKWYIDFTFSHKRIRQFGGYTKEQAKNILAKMRVEKLDEKLGFKKPKIGEDILFKKFADDFVETYSKQNKKSWRRDEAALKNLKSFFKDEMLQDIGPERVEKYKAKRKDKDGVSPATVNRELACLKTLFNKAVEWGRIENSPLRKVKRLREIKRKERILSDVEMAWLIQTASDHLKPFLVVALNSGMRKNEILSLRWSDIDFSKGFISIGDSKSGKSRNIPMNSSAFEALKGMSQASEFVFFNPKTKGHLKDIKTAFKTACKSVGIKGFRIHDLRHTAATKMIEAGVDLVTVSKILGHSSIQMTMRYAHPTPENMKRAVDKLGQIYEQARQKVDSQGEVVTIKKPVTSLLLEH